MMSMQSPIEGTLTWNFDWDRWQFTIYDGGSYRAKNYDMSDQCQHKINNSRGSFIKGHRLLCSFDDKDVVVDFERRYKKEDEAKRKFGLICSVPWYDKGHGFIHTMSGKDVRVHNNDVRCIEKKTWVDFKIGDTVTFFEGEYRNAREVDWNVPASSCLTKMCLSNNCGSARCSYGPSSVDIYFYNSQKFVFFCCLMIIRALERM